VPPSGIGDTVEDVEEPLDDEDIDEALDDEDVESPPGEVEPDEPGPAPVGDVEAIEDLIAKKDGHRAEEEEDPLLAMGREERLELPTVKVVPPQPTEFVCKKCYLVKHLSQLKDKKRMLCRDCA